MMSIFKKWAEREYPLFLRVLATLCAGSIFVLFIPLFFLHYGPLLDQALHLEIGQVGLEWKIPGSMLLAIGIFFALWSIADQIQNGKGTPIPAMATHNLLVHGPFRYSRNPMGFGTCLAYFGLSIFMASPAMAFLSAFFTTLFILYIKLVEEKELVERFGEPYKQYMQTTPFFIPRIR
jgi:protein-S-isoprenylcysteine O-methyltransferase Ste14